MHACLPLIIYSSTMLCQNQVDIGENLAKDICHRIEDVVQNQCLITGGVHLAGCWFTLAQAVCLELFIALTLIWTESKKQQRYHEVV